MTEFRWSRNCYIVGIGIDLLASLGSVGMCKLKWGATDLQISDISTPPIIFVYVLSAAFCPVICAIRCFLSCNIYIINYVHFIIPLLSYRVLTALKLICLLFNRVSYNKLIKENSSDHTIEFS